MTSKPCRCECGCSGTVWDKKRRCLPCTYPQHQINTLWAVVNELRRNNEQLR